MMKTKQKLVVGLVILVMGLNMFPVKKNTYDINLVYYSQYAYAGEESGEEPDPTYEPFSLIEWFGEAIKTMGF